MEKLKEKLGITGKYRVIIDRADGSREIGEYENTINTLLQQKINETLLTTADFALDALFNGVLTPPTTAEDGIILYDTEGQHYYETVCESSEPTSTTIKITGVFTGLSCQMTAAYLGFNHTAGDSGTFGVLYATPTAWNNVILAAADTLTIEWTIDCAP